MTLDRMNEDLNIIQKLDDEPNDVDGLTAQELKMKFDESGNMIQAFINGSLIPQIESLSEDGGGFAGQAQEYAEQAASSAGQASYSAETASRYAEEARQHAESLGTTVEEARQNAEAAIQSAANAQNAEIGAADSADAAKSSENAAKSSEESASRSASSAMKDAEAAKESAAAAKASEDNAKLSETAAAEAKEVAVGAKTAVENMGATADTVPADSETPVVEKQILDDGSVNLHFNVRQGLSGVYVGVGDMPEGYNVQIDPDGDVLDLQGLQDTAESAKATAESAMAIASGRATGYVFDTLSDLETALADDTFTANLVMGDNLYIRATDVPDYWWDGTQKQQLETEKPDLSGFVTADDVTMMINDALGVIENGAY